MKKSLQLLQAAILLLSISACSPEGNRVYVSPEGDDTNPGTIHRPLATITHARDVVRQFAKNNPEDNITVYLRGGEYNITGTIVFSTEDSGTPDQIITYAAYPDETPVLSAGVPVTNWETPADYPPELPDIAKDNVWVADVSFIRKLKEKQEASPTVATQMESRLLFHTLYKGNKRLPRARGDEFSLVEESSLDVSDNKSLHFPTGAIKDWKALDDAELHLIPGRIWISNVLPIADVDEKTGVAHTSFPCTYQMTFPWKMAYKPTVHVQNVPALLDEPGEWYLESKTDKLYYWPTDGEPGDNIIAPVLTEIIRIEGDIDYNGATDTPVRNLIFKGLTFTHGDRFPWHGRTGWGVQHDWERFDSPSAMLRFRGAENCTVEDCRFTNAGSSGIRFDLYCQKNKATGNHIEHIGGVGVLLAGYGPGTKDVNHHNEITNNLIHNIGELYWGSPAIFAWQSGENIISHNHLYNLPYTGICVTGRIVWDPEGGEECSMTIRWDEVEGSKDDWGYGNRAATWNQREKYLHARNNYVYRNDIHDATQVTGDANCIYVSGAGRGNIVKENYCHDVYGPRMHTFIRCDDDQHETLIERNILYKYYDGRGEGITSKGTNDIIGNLVVDLRNSPTDRHRGYIVFPDNPVVDSKVRENILYSMKKGQFVYGQGNVFIKGNPDSRLYPTRLRTTDADRNLYFCTVDPDYGTVHLQNEQGSGIEEHSLAADPMFTDLENEDFSFKPGSPALELGIRQPVPVDSIGLEPKYRARLEQK